MNLRSGRITNNNQPLPRRNQNNRMSNQQGEQNAPHGIGISASVSTGTSSAIPSNAQSVASSTSNIATIGTSGMSTNNSILDAKENKQFDLRQYRNHWLPWGICPTIWDTKSFRHPTTN